MKVMKIIGWIILVPLLCPFVPVLLLGACASEAVENWRDSGVQE